MYNLLVHYVIDEKVTKLLNYEKCRITFKSISLSVIKELHIVNENCQNEINGIFWASFIFANFAHLLFVATRASIVTEQPVVRSKRFFQSECFVVTGKRL